MSVTPDQVSVIDVPPSNSFTLVCSGHASSNKTVFTWSKQVLGSGSSTELIHNGRSVIITTSGNSSSLTISETQSGGYVYTCSARIGDGQASSDTAFVSVQGEACLLQCRINQHNDLYSPQVQVFQLLLIVLTPQLQASPR